MRSFRKLFVVIPLATGLAVGAFALQKEEEKPRTKDKKEAAKKVATDKADKADKSKEPRKIEIPVSKDHDAKGLKIPYFDGDGKKQMFFTIGVASKIDEEHVGLAETQIETFEDDGSSEMTIDLPQSVLNVNTSVISTKKHVEIKRDDFSLTGQTMEFNMKTKQGTLGGGVKMLIYNLEEEVPATPTPKVP